ncbi:hypothetical protein SSPIM334S_04535 [Streptomyces spiroverticillatus]
MPRLRQVLADLPMPHAAEGCLVLAVDVNIWLRPGAPTCAERLFCQERVGNVTRHRYEEIVSRAKELVAQVARAQFSLGNIALEIEPVRAVGGRYTANRWQAERRREGVSFTVHRTLASVADEAERRAAVQDAPFNPRTGGRQWTPDGAKRVVGKRVDQPATGDEQVSAVAEPTPSPASRTPARPRPGLSPPVPLRGRR